MVLRGRGGEERGGEVGGSDPGGIPRCSTIRKRTDIQTDMTRCPIYLRRNAAV